MAAVRKTKGTEGHWQVLRYDHCMIRAGCFLHITYNTNDQYKTDSGH